LLDHTFGDVRSVQCTAVTHIPERVDERGRRYAATADDAAFATFRLRGADDESDIIAQFNSSWAVRVYRDELLQIQVDGTLGSAPYTLRTPSAWPRPSAPIRCRVAYAAAHVVCDPLADADPLGEAVIDWDATLAFRRHLWSFGLAVAEAMDTAQRGMGLGWP